MLYMTREDRLLQLDKMSNTRDLGGYETRQGTYTKARHYIRASSPANASDNDLDLLYDYGVRVVIDLRSDFERENQPSRFKEYKGIECYEMNLFGQGSAVIVPEEVKNYKDLGGVYIYTLESSKEKIKEVFKIFLKYPYDTVLFHCSAGKDRTGIIAGLLLELAGCHDYDIVKDYSESYENNKDINEQLKKMMKDGDDKFLRSSPRYMMEFLDYLREHYGSAKEYLLNIGLNNEEIDELIENFTI